VFSKEEFGYLYETIQFYLHGRIQMLLTNFEHYLHNKLGQVLFSFLMGELSKIFCRYFSWIRMIKFGRHPYRTNPNPVIERFFLGRLYDRLYYLHLRGLLAWIILTGPP